MYRQQVAKKTSPTLRSTPRSKHIAPNRSYGSLSSVVQRAQQDPKTVSGDEWKQLDSAIGTRATQEILSGKKTPWVPQFKGISEQLWGNLGQVDTPIQTKLTIGAVGDKYEQEADRVAAAVVQQINRPGPVSMAQREVVQSKEIIDEDEPNMKPMVQRREAIGGEEATTDLESAINRARGSGQSLSVGLQQSMGQAMGADFSGVRVHTDVLADQLNQSIQAKAFTTGQDLFFKKGEYQPGSRGGQELIAHELTHVVQQKGVGEWAKTTSRRRVEGQEQQPKASLERRENRESTGRARYVPSHLRSALQPTDFLQGKLVTHKPNLTTKPPMKWDEEEREAHQKATKVDILVDKAFKEFQKGNYEGASEAQKDLYFKRKLEYDQGRKTIHPSTAAGYVIEGKANVGIRKLGFQTQATGILAGTRPDVEISLKTGKTALVDITASKSIGHIFSKAGNWTGSTKIPYVAESVYPSIDFSDVKATPALTDTEIERALQAVQENEERAKIAEQEFRDSQRERFFKIQSDLMERLLMVIEQAKQKKKAVRFSERDAIAWTQEWGIVFKGGNPLNQESIETMKYDEMITRNRFYVVPWQHRENYYDKLSKLMRQLV